MKTLSPLRIAAASLLLAVLALAAGPSGRDAAAAPRESHPPLPRIGKLAFADGRHARIPFDLRNNHVWVRGAINSSDSIWIVIDTGAESSVMDEGLARKLRLRMSGSHESMGAGGRQREYTAHDVTIQLPGVAIERKQIGATDLASITGAGGRPMQVIVGYELFRACVVRFDYAAGVIDVWDAKAAPRDLAGAEVPMRLRENHPYVQAELNVAGGPPIRGEFVIDTGSSQALIIAPDVVERESLATRVPRTLEIAGRGVGGESRMSVGRADAFRLGALTFEKPLMALARPSPGRISLPGTIGNIGGQILGRCRVTFDYARHIVRFEPAESFAEPFEADMSGMTLARADTTLEVRLVNPGTPAAEAGLATGDRNLRVDGAPVPAIDLAWLRQQLRTDGRSVKIEYRRGGEERSATVVLRRLI